MPVTVKLKDLRRALDVTAHVARGAVGAMALENVHIKRTKAGLVVEATDRFVLIRARVPVEDAEGSLPEVLLRPRAITKMLSMLSEGYSGVNGREQAELGVTISADEARKLATFEVRGFPVSLPIPDEAEYPDLGAVLKESTGGFTRDEPLNLNPALTEKVLRVHRHGAPGDILRFTDQENSDKSGIIKFHYGDWLTGALMPNRAPREMPDDSWARGDS